MIFNWLKARNANVSEPEQTWVFSENPIYEKEHLESKQVIEDIMTKLDEIKVLVVEMREKEGQVK